MKEGEKYDERGKSRVPESYSEDLTNNIVEKVEAKQESVKPGLLSLAKPHLMLAASMIVLVVISYATLRFILPEFGHNNSEEYIEEITEYLSYEMDEASLLENIDLSLTEDYSSEISATLSIEEIIEYLADQDINYESLLESL